MDIWQRLVDYWRRCGVTIRPGVDLAAVVTFEAEYQTVLPSDVRSYFEVVDGMWDQMDPDLIRFWPLNEMKPVHEVLTGANPDRFAYPSCFLFADHCISCWCYAVKLGESSEERGAVFLVTGGEPPGKKLADSIAEFVEMYLTDVKSIYPP